MVSRLSNSKYKMKVCRKCMSKKDIKKFYKHKRMPDGRRNSCIDCDREHYKNNKHKYKFNKFKELKQGIKVKNSNKTSDISEDYYNKIISLGCFYCGKNVMSEKGHSLDRVDNNEGYYSTNIKCCCKICNKMKSNMTILNFYDHIKRILNKRGARG